MNESPVAFVPFTSSIDAGFWYELNHRKLNIWKLDDSRRSITGHFTNSTATGLPPFFSLCDQAFKEERLQISATSYEVHGELINTNTKEDFAKLDKKALLDEKIRQFVNNVEKLDIFKYPSNLVSFVMVCFADLKKYKFVYWICFPSIHIPGLNAVTSTISDVFGLEELTLFHHDRNLPIFAVNRKTKNRQSDISELMNVDLTDVYFVIVDPSSDAQNPGWPTRNFIYAILHHFSDHTSEIRVVCLREKLIAGELSLSDSLVLTIQTSISKDLEGMAPGASGWEKNKGKLLPKSADLSNTMDPKILSANAVELNLRLMKWRIAPSLDLDFISKQKCLLLGAGTLGCNVARLLMAWGVKDITLVDNGRVSFSNPVRQSLFTFEDTCAGGAMKAEAAAKHLQQINPSVNVQSHTFSIPMPGHPIAAAELQQVQNTVKLLSDLIRSHDSTFLLLDSREARWLPAMLGKFHGKLIMNAALGFDSYLVMRHGLTSSSPEDELGCYFCSDVMAPGNSMLDRSLDQMCTVSRPGVSMIASSLVVELFTSVITHPDGPSAKVEAPEDCEQYPLGFAPHQIRGWLSQGNCVYPTCGAYSRCVACSRAVLHLYQERGLQFLLDVFNDPMYLEEVTGLAQMKLECVEDNDIQALSDDESF